MTENILSFDVFELCLLHFGVRIISIHNLQLIIFKVIHKLVNHKCHLRLFLFFLLFDYWLFDNFCGRNTGTHLDVEVAFFGVGLGHHVGKD